MARNAPGKHFRKGMSLIEVMRMFPDAPAAERWFAETRWPGGVRRPHCGSGDVRDGTAHRSMRFRRRTCRKRFSVRAGTVTERSSLGFPVRALAGCLMTTEPERTVEQEAAPRSRRHAEDGLASGASHPENRAKNAGGLFPGPVAADGPMQAASGRTCGCPGGSSRRDGGRRARPRSSARRGGSATPFPRTLFPMPARKRFRASRPAMRPGCDRPCRRRGVQEHAVSGMGQSAIRSANV